jgi:peptidoglycan/LPS O-acetylase OafA/YrhL
MRRLGPLDAVTKQFQTEPTAEKVTHYRKDIDGLRALAVVPVVLFHAGVAPFSGGFTGVDVFFVISGYLITSASQTHISCPDCCPNFRLGRYVATAAVPTTRRFRRKRSGDHAVRFECALLE